MTLQFFIIFVHFLCRMFRFWYKNLEFEFLETTFSGKRFFWIRNLVENEFLETKFSERRNLEFEFWEATKFGIRNLVSDEILDLCPRMNSSLKPKFCHY